MKVELICPIDWGQRKYELAKAAMQGMCAGNNRSIDSFRSKDIRRCIEIANTMIYQLKESEVNNG